MDHGSMAKTSFDSQIVNHEPNWTSTGSQAPTNWGLTYGCAQHIASSLDTPGKELTVSCWWACYNYPEDLSLEGCRTERQAMSPASVRTAIACARQFCVGGRLFSLQCTAHNGAVSGGWIHRPIAVTLIQPIMTTPHRRWNLPVIMTGPNPVRTL